MFVPAAKKSIYSFYPAIAALAVVLFSCSIKNYPHNRPFVYQTNINIVGKYSTDEKKNLVAQLEQQLHDSIKVRSTRKIFFWHSLKNPAVYDSLNASKSILYMNVLLNSLGYYRDTISFSSKIKTIGDKQEVTVDFTVTPGKQVKLDSIWYNLLDSVVYQPNIDTLQQLTIASLNEGQLKKGAPFSKPVISSELDRLSDVYRDNGYLRFSKEQLIAVWDTVGIGILRFTTDPNEQLRQLEALRERRENPIADVEVRLKSNPDTTRFIRYFIGNVKIYPDYSVDTAMYQPTIQILSHNRYEFISYANLFKPKKLVRFFSFERGSLYRQSNYLKTQTKLNSLGAWRLVTINQIPRPGTDTVDFEIQLIPAKKYFMNLGFDASKSQGNFVTESNLLGFGATYTLVNHNFLRAANQSTLNIRYGIELGNQLNDIQTQQFNLGYTIQFPRMIPRGFFGKKITDPKTFLSFNLGNTNRADYYTLQTVTTSWAWQFQKDKYLFDLRFPNIEYNFLKKGSGLIDLINQNPSFKYIFNDGLIFSAGGNITRITGSKTLSKLMRLGLELSWLPFHSAFIDSNLYPFARLDFERTITKKIRRTALAFRVFGGVGYEFSLAKNRNNLYLPFFRQFYAGGPNSMRAWSVRKLGPGSSVKSFTSDPDRFGDVKLESNFEWRYYITKVFGFPMEGALFVDAGNVWFLRKNADFVNGEFPRSFKRLGEDIGVGVGTGLRIDFGFLKARFDFAYKAKDPNPEDASYQNKWFYKWKLNFTDPHGAQFQLGINYPF